MNGIDCSIETEKRWKLREEVGRKCGGTSGEDILAQYNVTPAIAIKDADRVGNQRKQKYENKRKDNNFFSVSTNLENMCRLF